MVHITWPKSYIENKTPTEQIQPKHFKCNGTNATPYNGTNKTVTLVKIGTTRQHTARNDNQKLMLQLINILFFICIKFIMNLFPESQLHFCLPEIFTAFLDSMQTVDDAIRLFHGFLDRFIMVEREVVFH